ncbi:MAG: hypothetical protein ACI9FJ_002900, partial [Alteromonadaceae bacterium]
NVKNSIHGAYHSINPKHLPHYLGAFCYRFNRRFERDKMLPRFMRSALKRYQCPIGFSNWQRLTDNNRSGLISRLIY